MGARERNSLITPTGCSPNLVEDYRLLECFLCAILDAVFYYETH